MAIFQVIKYTDESTAPRCMQVTSSAPSLSVNIVLADGGLVCTHGRDEIDEIHIIHTGTSNAPFTLHGNFDTGVGGPDPRISEAHFEYTGAGAQVEPLGGGMTWSRNNGTLSFVFHPLDPGAGETEGMWTFGPVEQPPVKLKVVIKRKGSYTCPQ